MVRVKRRGSPVDYRLCDQTVTLYSEGEYMRRDALRDIAAAHGGNWYMSDAGKLRLVPLISFPAETNLLVTEYGSALVFGGVRILV